MTSDKRYRVLIVGCGQLGSRHLQAVASLPNVEEIEVVDPRPESLEMGRQRLSQVDQRNHFTQYRWLSSLEEARKDGDLCIVATQAEGRCQLVPKIYQSLGYSNFILEKIVGQSVAEIEGLHEFCQEKGIHAWVNFQTRAYPFHKRVKTLLTPGEPITFSVVGGNQGLATNGVHNADLFAFYDESSSVISTGSNVDPVLHPSKRGESLFELSGTLNGITDKGSRFSLTYSGDHMNSEQIFISSPRYRCIVDHVQCWAVESDESSDWAWRQVPFDGDFFVSKMTRQFASDILATGQCELPSLEESLTAHRFILSELQPHFSRLLEREIQLCPVT